MIAALAALVLALAPAPAQGLDETRRLGTEIETHVWSPWPQSAHRGWVPVFVDLRNEGERSRFVRIEAVCEDSWVDRRVRTAVQVEPGSGARVEVLVPMGGLYWNSYRVLVETDGYAYHFANAAGSGSVMPDRRQVVVLGGKHLREDVARWSAALSTKSLGDPRSFGLSLPMSVPGVSATVTTTGHMGPATAVPDDVDVSHTGFQSLPRHHGAYSSLDLVVLDPSDGMPDAAELAPLVAWVRGGGDLFVIGEEGWKAARTIPELAAWMEPRFETNGELGSEYRCGLGRLFVGDVPGDLGDEYAGWVREALDARGSLTPKAGPWRGLSAIPRIPGLEMLPVRTFAVLLMLFAFVIGPVNFFFVWKRKKPVLLLFTIPVIALGTTVALLAYGILFQGLDVKTASYTLAVLDQREHRATSVEMRELFVGLAPAAGLEPDAGTIVHHFENPRMPHTTARRRLTAELENGLLLGGDFLPSRKAVSQVIASDRAERARLDVHRSGAALAVDNNLGVAVEELFVRDPQGALHRLDGRLEAGGSATLTAVGPSEGSGRLHDLLSVPIAATPKLSSDPLPAGCYAARLASGVFRDDCGLETNELDGHHAVLGILALDAEAWR